MTPDEDQENAYRVCAALGHPLPARPGEQVLLASIEDDIHYVVWAATTTDTLTHRVAEYLRDYEGVDVNGVAAKLSDDDTQLLSEWDNSSSGGRYTLTRVTVDEESTESQQDNRLACSQALVWYADLDLNVGTSGTERHHRLFTTSASAHAWIADGLRRRYRRQSPGVRMPEDDAAMIDWADRFGGNERTFVAPLIVDAEPAVDSYL